MLNDPITQIAEGLNDGYKGLYPFETVGVQNAPWQWWDVCPYNVQGLQTNPDMSEVKGQAYIDTIMAYMAPRMAISNGFLNSGVGVDELDANSFEVYPNPANNILNISYEGTGLIKQVSMMDVSGRTISQTSLIRGQLDVSELPPGLYLLRFELENGFYSKYVVVQ
jgi:hypothetical protein